jgi:predicted phage replisome organizer
MNISWMKLDVNILNDSKIKIIRKYPDGNSLFVLWVGLLCLAMKSDVTGYVYITQGLPYTADDLATEFNLEVKTVEMGIELFRKMGMIDFTEGNMIEIVNFNKHQNIDKIEKQRLQTRERVKKHRLKQCNALLISHEPVTNVDVTPQIRIDKNRIDKSIEEKKGRTFTIPTVDEVQSYLQSLNITQFTAQYFIDWNSARGWMLGKNKMKDWKAAVRTWRDRAEKETKKDNYEEL